MQTGTWRDRGIAWGIVLAWHAVLAWWLLHALPLPSTRDDADALQVVYVTLPPVSPAPPPVDSAMRRTALQARTVPPRRTPPSTAIVHDPAKPAARLSLAQLLSQAGSDARRQAVQAASARDRFADRPTRLPAADAGRFRMQAAVTPAQVLGLVGKLVGGADYEMDPCPRNRRNIADLLAAGDSSHLRLELEFDRRHCRP